MGRKGRKSDFLARGQRPLRVYRLIGDLPFGKVDFRKAGRSIAGVAWLSA